jgi:hypothetical protein
MSPWRSGLILEAVHVAFMMEKHNQKQYVGFGFLTAVGLGSAILWGKSKKK